MNRCSVYILGGMMFITQLITAQEGILVSKDSNKDTIPFKLTAHNNISIQAVLNQVDTLNLMFHTAANGVTLIKKATENLTSITWSRGDTVKSWGGTNESRNSENNTLQIGEFNWTDISIWENENSGPTTDGKFGPKLFENKVLEIDFDKSILVIHQELPNKITEYENLPLAFENDFMFLEATSIVEGQTYPNRFLIHSGFGGSILFDDQFVQESQLGRRIKITDEQELKDSYGNIVKTKKGVLPKFMIGNSVFKDISVGFFEGSIGRQKMSVIGGSLLKRFNLIIDSNRENIYINPSQLND